MKSMMARTQGVVRSYGYHLPLVVLKKLLSRMLTAETVLLYSRLVPSKAGSSLPVSAESALPHLEPFVTAPLVIRRVESAEAPLFAALCYQFPQKHFASRWSESGTQCFVAVNEDVIAGFAWVGRDRLHIAEVNYDYQVGSDELFIYDCFVTPAFRGKGIYPLMISAILENSAGLPGIRRALIAVSSINRPSIRGILKAGFTGFGRIVYLNCYGHERWWGLGGTLRKPQESQ